MPDILYAVLLEKIPDSDGMNGQLHGAPLDQPVELMIRDQHYLAIVHPLLFRTMHGAQVHGLGLVHSDGRLGFAGGLRGRSLSSSPMEAFVFPSHQVLLKGVCVFDKPAMRLGSKPSQPTRRQATLRAR